MLSVKDDLGDKKDDETDEDEKTDAKTLKESAKEGAKAKDKQTPDKDDVYASTPLLASLKILVVIALIKDYAIVFGDISTANVRTTPSKLLAGGRSTWQLPCRSLEDYA